jgi:hypothetical protein
MDGAGGAAGGSFEPIQTLTAAGGETSLSFTSIPSTYKHLQIRGISRDTTASTGDSAVVLQLNSDTGSNYSTHRVNTYGATPSINVQGFANYPYVFLPAQPNDSTTANAFMAVIIDIHDYASTTKNKTVRLVGGTETNQTSSSGNGFGSGAWYSLSAVTSVQIKANTTSFKSGSTFALYGIKG